MELDAVKLQMNDVKRGDTDIRRLRNYPTRSMSFTVTY